MYRYEFLFSTEFKQNIWNFKIRWIWADYLVFENKINDISNGIGTSDRFLLLFIIVSRKVENEGIHYWPYCHNYTSKHQALNLVPKYGALSQWIGQAWWR